jgi:hypothetical protein
MVVFSLRAFDCSTSMDVSGLFVMELAKTITASCEAVILISTINLRDMFRFQTDGISVGDVTDTDTKYFIDQIKFAEIFSVENNYGNGQENGKRILNPSNINLDNKRENFNAITGLDNNNNIQGRSQNLIRSDFVRYLAYKLTGSINNTDLFLNENELISDLGEKGYNIHYNHIVPIFQSAGTLLNPLTNSDSSDSNIVRSVLGQMASNESSKTRFNASNLVTVNGINSAEYSIKTTNEHQPVMFQDGDILEFKYVIFPQNNQEVITGVERFGARTYNIKIIAVDNNKVPSLNERPQIVTDNNYYFTDISANSYFKNEGGTGENIVGIETI